MKEEKEKDGPLFRAKLLFPASSPSLMSKSSNSTVVGDFNRRREGHPAGCALFPCQSILIVRAINVSINIYEAVGDFREL